MQFKTLLAPAALWIMVTASPLPVPQTGPNQTPAEIQANVQAAQGAFLSIINDLAQGTSAVAAYDALKASLTPLVDFPCPASTVAPATSADEAIEDLQEVQLELEVVSLATQDADKAGSQAAVCSALDYFTAAGGFIDA